MKSIAACLGATFVWVLVGPGVLAAQQGEPSGVCEVDANPAAVFGDASANPLGYIVAGAFVNDTVLAVGDRTASEILFLQTTGTVLGRHGRDGEGPGEFRTIQYVSAHADTAVIYDRARRRVSLIAQDGYIRSFESNVGVAQLLPHDRVVLVSRGGRAPASDGPVLWQDTLRVFIGDVRDSEEAREIVAVAGERRISQVRPEFSVHFAPYTAVPVVAANHEHIVVADGRGEIHKFGTEGTKISSSGSPFSAQSLGRGDLTRWVEYAVSQTRVGRQESTRRLLSNGGEIERAPAHGGIALDRMGTLWVEEYVAPFEHRDRTLIAFNRRGQAIARTMIDARLSILAASPIAIALLRADEYGTHTIQIHSVVCRR